MAFLFRILSLADLDLADLAGLAGQVGSVYYFHLERSTLLSGP